MYQLKNAVVLSRSIGSQWENKNLSNTLVFDIYNNYSKVYLILQHNTATEDIFVDMDALKSLHSNFQGSLITLLDTLRNVTLPTVLEIPSTNVKRVKYSDAFRSKYKAELCIAGRNLPAGFPQDDLNDVKLSRPGYHTDPTLLHDTCLLTVNGFIHNTAKDNDYTYILDAGKTLRKTRDNHIGIVSFKDLGNISKHKITSSNIFKQHETSTLRERIYFNIDKDLNGKSFILVLGGYLITPKENVLWQVGDKTIALDINKISYIDKLFELKTFTDISELDIRSHTEDHLFDIEEIYSDRVLTNLLTMSKTFVLVIDKNGFSVNKINLRHSALPGMFISYQDPTYPLIVGHGRIAEYWKTQEGDQWSVNVSDSYLRNFILSNRQEPFTGGVSSTVIPHRPFHPSQGYLLELSAYDLT